MFRPNLTCIISVSSGETDVYGKPMPAKRVTERCAIVKLDIKNTKTSVRADTSASRGNARELIADSVILLTKNTVANRITESRCRAPPCASHRSFHATT